MLTEALPSVMCPEPLAIPSGNPEDGRGDIGHSPSSSWAPACPYLEVLVLLHQALIGQNLVDGDPLAAHPAQACEDQRTGGSLASGMPASGLTARARGLGHRRATLGETRPLLPGDGSTHSLRGWGGRVWGEGMSPRPASGWQLPCSLSGQRVGWHSEPPESSTWSLLLRMSSPPG